MNIDAINFLDAIADVTKQVIGVDDKWFSVKCLDWDLNTKNPSIEVKLYQPTRFIHPLVKLKKKV